MSTIAWAQDLSNIVKAKPFDYNGGINFSLNYYNPQGNSYRSLPWQYAFTGNASVSFYGIQLPFNFYINNYQSGLSHPFNFYGISPSYKWAKLHLGHRSLSFSPYTLSGQTFWGAAIELNPGIFRFSALYGTFRNYIYIPNDDIQKTNLLPSFKRKGYGFKIGIGKQNTYLDLIYFKAKDENQMEIPFSDTINIYPKENLVIGLNGSISLFKIFHIYINSAISAFTPDNTSESILTELENYQFVGKIMDPKISTRLGFAGDAGINFRLRKFMLGIKYQRIDPSYESLGTNYFMNDVEALTFNNSFSFLKSKISVNSSLGLMRNNLLNNKISTNNRIIGSINSNIRFNKTYQLQFSYTNFKLDQSIEIVDINDTIQYAQTNQAFRLAPMISFGNSNYKHSINPVFLQSGFITLNGHTNTTTDVKSNMAMINYSLTKPKSSLSFNGNISWRNYITSVASSSNRLGTSIGINKNFKEKKISINSSVGYNTSIGESAYNSQVFNIRGSVSYQLFKKQNISFSTYYINRNTDSALDINEIRFFLNYSYQLK